MKKLILTSTIYLVAVLTSFASNVPFWSNASKESFNSQFGVADIKTNRAAYLTLDFSGIKNYLATAPMERSGVAGLKLYLPTPDGNQQEFAVYASPVMENGLAVRYPEIKTYLIQGVTNPAACGRLDFTYLGFHAMILDGDKTFFIDPYNRTTTNA
jgi:hypothetical protein